MIVALLCVPLLFAFLSPPHFAHLPPATYYYSKSSSCLLLWFSIISLPSDSFSKMTENVVRERVLSLYHIVTGEVEGPKSVSFVSNEPGSEGDVLPSFLHEHKISISSWDIEANLTGSPVTPVPFIQQPYLLPHDSLPLIELLFPDYNQSIRRSWAERYGLVVADKADWSDELCHFFGELALATRLGPRLHSSLPDIYKVRHIR